MANILLADELISTILIRLTIFIIIEINTKVKLSISKNEKPKVLDAHTEVKRILDQPNPCEQLALIDDLDFILLSKKNLRILRKLKFCLMREDIFMKALDSAFMVKSKNVIVNFFIPFARKTFPHLIPRIFYECAFHSHYNCINEIIKKDTLINYKGQNILHLAAKLDDLRLANYSISLRSNKLLRTFRL